jgi:hypothetical protein
MQGSGLAGRLKRTLGGSKVDPAQDRSYTKPHLTPVQQRTLDALTTDGIAIVRFDELYADTQLWEEMSRDMDEFVAHAESLVASGGAHGKKDFLIRRYPRKGKLPDPPAVLPTDGPWLRFAAGDPLLDVVNSYRGVKTKLVDFDLWYTIPTAGESDRHASQEWHRDPEDLHVVKVFVYFSDVDEDAGPFEYIRKSFPGSKYGDLWPWGEEERYPPSDELERTIDDADRMLATGTKGSIVIADTSGFHRGGYAKTTPRVLATQTYVNKKITAERPDRRKFQVDWREHALSDQARFALG